MYYGFYGMSSKWQNAATKNWFSDGIYNLPLAYQLAIVIFYVFSLYRTSTDVMQSWKKGIQVGMLSGNDLARKIFSAWDFSIGKEKTKQIRQRQIMVMLREELHSKRRKKKKLEDKESMTVKQK